MTEIINFPTTADTFPTSRQEAEEHINEVRKEYCDNVAGDIFEACMQAFSAYGFSIKSNENHIKDIVFVEEAIRSMVYRYKNLSHQLHEISDMTISLSDDAKEELENRANEKLLNN